MGRRRHHSWPMVATRPEPPAVDPATRSPVESAQIRVVEYVLPAVQAPIAETDSRTDYGLHPGQTAPVMQAGFDL